MARVQTGNTMARQILKLIFTFSERQLPGCSSEEAGGVQGVQEEAQAPQGGAEGKARDQLQHPPDQAQAVQQVSKL